MDHLPVSGSTLSAGPLARFVQEKYRLSQGTKARLLKTGINHAYLITSGDTQYIFRVYSYNWRTTAEILEEVRFLNILRDAGIPVAYPLLDQHNHYVQHLTAPEGDRQAVLFTYASGGKLLNFPADLHYKVGVNMARMHEASEKITLDRVHYDTDVLLVQSMEQLKAFLDPNCEEMRFMEHARHYITEVYRGADAAQLRYGAVHMDIWFDNMHFHNGEATLFDFDFCGNGWLSHDIAYYLLQVHSTEKEPAERAEKAAAFLRGYESVTPVTPEEKRLIPTMATAMYMFYLGIQCERYDNWSNVFLNEIYLKRFINLLVKKWWEDHHLPMS